MISLLIAKIISMLGLTGYLFVAVFNNWRDKGTNRFLLNQMFGMELLKSDLVLGRGLLNRAIDTSSFATNVLKAVVLVQAVLVVLLLLGSIELLMVLFAGGSSSTAVATCNIAVSCFMALWFFFWCGGLWFGYWIKTGQIQEVHMKLIILSILELIFLNCAN